MPALDCEALNSVRAGSGLQQRCLVLLEKVHMPGSLHRFNRFSWLLMQVTAGASSWHYSCSFRGHVWRCS